MTPDPEVIVTLRHCNCLKATTSRVRDMLVAEGFTVNPRVTLKPLTLQVEVQGQVVWSYALWRRRVPDQQTLVSMIKTLLKKMGSIHQPRS